MYKRVKKEDKKDREVRGGVVSSSGMYAFKYMSSGETSQRASTGSGDFDVRHRTCRNLVEVPLNDVSFLPDFLNNLYEGDGKYDSSCWGYCSSPL